MEREGINHASIMAMMKGYYADVLERETSKIDESGPLLKKRVAALQKSLKEWDEIIEAGADDVVGLLATLLS